ncbi:tetratricopeptide repeat protein, partial [Candidatus Sumerlaeota bacterium]|nr:tetratricopeptide repeat protein [Candidatus Sumerlaeota bacterium]
MKRKNKRQEKAYQPLKKAWDAPLFWKAVLLCFVTFIAFIPALKGGFIWDDNGYIIQNPTLRNSNGLRQIWFSPGSTTQYYPVLFTLFRIEYQIWGLNPFGYHLVNIILHILNTVILLILLRHLNVPGSLLIAAVFSVHPIHVESVAWICELKDVLSGFFFLLTLYFWLEYEKNGKWAHYGGSLVLFLLAIFSKTAVTPLPALLFLWILFKKRGNSPRQFLFIAPFFLISLVSGLHHSILEVKNIGDASGDVNFTIWQRLYIAGRGFWFYPMKIIWPSPLLPIYPRWELGGAKIVNVLWPFSVAAFLFLLWMLRNRIGIIPFAGVTFYTVMILPALGIVSQAFYRFSFTADHFQYLAGIGIMTAIIVPFYDLYKKYQFYLKQVVPVFSGMLLITLVILTWRHNIVFQSNESLWKHAISHNREAFVAYHNLAHSMIQRNKQSEAITLYQEAIRANPDYKDARLGLGVLLIDMERYDESIKVYRDAIDLHQDFAP